MCSSRFFLANGGHTIGDSPDIFLPFHSEYFGYIIVSRRNKYRWLIWEQVLLHHQRDPAISRQNYPFWTFKGNA